MGTDHRMVPAIKQTLSMLGQAREALAGIATLD
jgi:hypothetical protein